MKAFKDRNLILWTYSTVQGYVQKQVEKSRGSDFMTNTMSLFLCDSVIKVSTCVHMQYEHIRCTLKLLVHFFFITQLVGLGRGSVNLSPNGLIMGKPAF